MKKIYLWSILILTTLTSWSTRVFAQEIPTDSCTIIISTGYYYNGNGWNDSYLQLLQQGQVVAIVQHQKWTPNNYSVTVPANEKTDFNWISDNTPVSFTISSSTGELLYAFNNIFQDGIFFSYYVCSAPRNVSELTITPSTDSPFGATLSWTNPTQTINNDLLQTIDSIVLLKNNTIMTTLYNLTPGIFTQYTDNTFHAGDYYTVITYSGPMESLPISATEPACRYKLNLHTNYANWSGGSLKFSSKGHLLGTFSLNHYGDENKYIDLPNDWITIEYQGIRGSFALYDENDSLILAGPGGLPERFQWYNGCSLSVPDTATAVSHSKQGNVVNLAWTNPNVSVYGDTLTAISKVEVRRNEELIHTFTETVPGGQLSLTDTTPSDGTYLYAVQCFNEAGGGVPAITYVTTGSNWTLHDFSNTGLYIDTTCLVSITNDASYTNGGIVTVTVYQSDTTKMLKISGSSTITDGTSISVYAGTPENGVQLSFDTLCVTTTYRSASFVMDIPVGSSPQFYYTVECVNSLYEQPDTTIAIVPDSNSIIYVTQEGAGLRNGSSWANATPWLNRALAAADTMIEKPVIWVAKGTYYGTPQQYNNETYAFIGRSNVNVFGGFAGNEPSNYDLSLRNFEQNETTLAGLLQHTIVWVKNSEWNGFHILNGRIGCMIKEGDNHNNSILRKCRVTDCLQAGVYSRSVSFGSLRMVDSCLILNNRGNGIDAQIISVSNTTIAYNEGDGLLARGAISNCSITHNKGRGYANTVGTNSSATICNCLVANNNSTGMSLRYEIVLNSTIVNNGGVGVEVSFDCMLGNCIIWGNKGESIVRLWNHDYEIRNCAVDGDFKHSSYPNIPLASPNDTFGFHPDFVSPTAGAGSDFSGGDWHLMPTSVCVNRGTTKYDNYPLTDLDGNIRIQQGIPDIGAYESQYDHPYEEGKIIYIKTDGDGDGSSWANATENLDNAIESAWIYGPGTRIWVAQGTYPTPSRPYYLKENLHLIGGFVGDEPTDYDIDLRNTIEHASILDGQQQNRVLHQTIDFERPAVVDGFTLTYGQADEGSGAYLMEKTTLSKCRVMNNIVTSEGAAVVIAARDTLKQLLVENNDGTGVHAESSQLLHCTVVRNNGDGIQVSGNAIQDSSLLYNNISWGNALLSFHFTSAMAKQNTFILHCALENQIVDGENNIVLSSNNGSEAGPRFINPTDSVGVVTNLGDWQIDSSSVCVNAGTELSDLYGIHTDLTGQPRIQNGNADVGTLESPYSSGVLCRNMEVSIYEGESYTFYGTTLTAAGWYEHRWNVGEADSLVVLHLITKQVIYVSISGAGNMDGSSWANALDGQTATANGSTKLADALHDATAGIEFWIQSGTYYACSDSDVNKSLILNEGVALYGGFAGTETSISQRDTNNSPTVFSGNLQNDSIVEHYSRNIFKTNEQNIPDKVILLDNISITEGYNNLYLGSALHIGESSNVRANRCHIHHNFGSAIANEGQFTGIYCTLDSNISYYDYYISHHTYYDGYSYFECAAALTNKSSGRAYFHHCTISHNQAPQDGALFNIGVMVIDSSSILNNKSTDGIIGAILNENVLTITNSVLANNWAYTGYSTIFSIGKLKLHNCIVDSNQSLRINPEYNFPVLEVFPSYHHGFSSHIRVYGDVEIDSCLFRNNNQNKGTHGGCVHVTGSATIKKCEFVDNLGAGIFQPGQDCMMCIVYNHGGIDGCVYVSSGNVAVEDCLFDSDFGGGGTAAGVNSGKLTMNRCVFTRNQRLRGIGQEGVLAIQSGELHVQNSLFANNQNAVFNTSKSAGASQTTFSNCTFVNNEGKLCLFNDPNYGYGPEPNHYYALPDTAYVHFNNSIIVGNWDHESTGIGVGDTSFSPNYRLQFTNTLFHHPDSTLASNCTPDSLGNIYYCDPMFVNPTTVMGVDSAQNPLLYDFRLQDGSPAINSGDTTGLHLTADATDLDGEQRVKRCQIDRGCYEYGTIVYDTVRETLCVEQDALNQLSYNGYGFSIEQLEVGENTFTRTCDCHPDANDSVQTLQLNVSLIQYSEFDTVACDSFEWHDETFTASGIYTRTFSDAAGCDSIVTLHLTLNHAETAEFEETVCDSYTWNDQTYTASGDYTQTLTNASGCDSVVTLHLTVHEAVETVINDYLCNGSTYSFFEQELIYPGTYTHVGQTVFGCDSIVTLHLELKQTYTSFMNVTLCNGEGYEFFGETLYEAGTYTQTVPTEFGCDSTVILTVTTGATTYGELNASICDGSSYNFYGQQLTEAGDYTVTLTNSHGCDSILTLHLTVNHATHNVETETACDSYTWHGTVYTASGTYTYEYTNSNGCASVDTLLLTINFAQFAQFADTAYDSYTWNGQTYTASGDYTQTFTAANGCDSIVTLHLTLTVGIDDHNLGASMTVYPNPTTGVVVNVQCTMYNIQAGEIEFQLFDAFGRLLRTTNGIGANNYSPLRTDIHGSSVQTAQIDLSEFAAGVYFVKAVADGNVVAVRKVVKR